MKVRFHFHYKFVSGKISWKARQKLELESGVFPIEALFHEVTFNDYICPNGLDSDPDSRRFPGFAN
jgi:hypothetical protein